MEKIKIWKIFEFFHNRQFWFFNIYLSLIEKLSNIKKNTKNLILPLLLSKCLTHILCSIKKSIHYYFRF
jgi:hypothetical protein